MVCELQKIVLTESRKGYLKSSSRVPNASYNSRVLAFFGRLPHIFQNHTAGSLKVQIQTVGIEFL